MSVFNYRMEDYPFFVTECAGVVRAADLYQTSRDIAVHVHEQPLYWLVDLTEGIYNLKEIQLAPPFEPVRALVKHPNLLMVAVVVPDYANNPLGQALRVQSVPSGSRKIQYFDHRWHAEDTLSSLWDQYRRRQSLQQQRRANRQRYDGSSAVV